MCEGVIDKHDLTLFFRHFSHGGSSAVRPESDSSIRVYTQFMSFEGSVIHPLTRSRGLVEEECRGLVRVRVGGFFMFCVLLGLSPENLEQKT